MREILDKINDIMTEIKGIGRVYKYLRWSNDWKSFLDLFKDSGVIRGWMITRTSTQEEADSFPYAKRLHTFKIIGVHSLSDKDASELVFQDLIETICDTFRSNVNLDGLVVIAYPIQVMTVENRMFGSVLCHYAELELRCWERKKY